jgi:hypothetical protein
VDAAMRAAREAPPEPVPADLEAGVSPSAGISSRIDTVAVILADDPVTRDQLEPLLAALSSHANPVHVRRHRGRAVASHRNLTEDELA